MNCDNCGLNGNDCSRGDGSDCARPRPLQDEDVRLLVLDLCQQCLDSVGCEECKHFDTSFVTGGCSLMHRILAYIAQQQATLDALVQEHEATDDIAYFLRSNPGMVVTLHVEGKRGSITLGPTIRKRFLAARDNAERLMKEGRE